MLSLSEEWYRKLMVAALVLGVGGGVIALVYSGVQLRHRPVVR
jgi:hypothetical protein